MGRTLLLALTLAAIWLLLSGFFDKPLLLAFGTASVIVCVFLAARLRLIDDEGAPTGLMPGIFGYWLWLGGEIGKSNIAVARQALSVKPELSPVMIRVPMAQKTAVGRVTFANSITLTPGTVSIDMAEEGILVHGLTAAIADEAAIADMGARVAKTERGAR